MTTSSASMRDLLPAYNLYDGQTATQSVNTANAALGGTDGNGMLLAAPDAVRRGVDMQAVPGHSQAQLAQIEALFMQRMSDYLDDTYGMVMMNDLANVNSFASQTVDRETARLTQLQQRTNADVIKARKSYLDKRYALNYTRFVTGLVQFTLVAAACCGFVLFGRLGPSASTCLLSVTLVLYVVITIVAVRSALRRRKDDWNKYYFKDARVRM